MLNSITTKKGYAIMVEGQMTAVYKTLEDALGVLPYAKMCHFLSNVCVELVYIGRMEKYGTRSIKTNVVRMKPASNLTA